MRIVVAGIGNLMMSDDGLGVEAVERLRDLESEDVRIIPIGTAVLRSEGHLVWADRVLAIDALQWDREPGAVWMGGLEDMEAAGVGASTHGLGLLKLWSILPEDARPRVSVIGVQPERMGFGMGLSPTVAASLSEVERLARNEVAAWKTEAVGP